MALWLIRSRNAEDDAAALDQGMVLIGFTDVANLGTARNKKEFQLFCQRALVGKSPGSVSRILSQLWAFRGRIKQEDLVLMPRQHRGGVAVGKIAGPYEYRDGLPGGSRHVRKVEWLRRAIPRSILDEDILLSMSAAASIAPILRRNGEARIRTLVGLQGQTMLTPSAAEGEDALEADYGTNLEENARDQLRLRLEKRFPGGELVTLIEALLQAQGYRTHRTTPDEEGVVTLMAGSGPMGLEAPRLCAQVRSSPKPEDANTVKDFRATVKNCGADQGLLIAWRGFQRAAVAESEQRFFEVRLWDDEDIMEAVMASYPRLPASIQTSLSLQRIWIPAPEDD